MSQSQAAGRNSWLHRMILNVATPVQVAEAAQETIGFDTNRAVPVHLERMAPAAARGSALGMGVMAEAIGPRFAVNSFSCADLPVEAKAAPANVMPGMIVRFNARHFGAQAPPRSLGTVEDLGLLHMIDSTPVNAAFLTAVRHAALAQRLAENGGYTPLTSVDQRTAAAYLGPRAALSEDDLVAAAVARTVVAGSEADGLSRHLARRSGYYEALTQVAPAVRESLEEFQERVDPSTGAVLSHGRGPLIGAIRDARATDGYRARKSLAEDLAQATQGTSSDEPTLRHLEALRRDMRGFAVDDFLSAPPHGEADQDRTGGAADRATAPARAQSAVARPARPRSATTAGLGSVRGTSEVALRHGPVTSVPPLRRYTSMTQTMARTRPRHLPRRSLCPGAAWHRARGGEVAAWVLDPTGERPMMAG